MRFPIVLVLFSAINVVYVSSVHRNIHNVYDVKKVNNVDRDGFVAENNKTVEFVPWRVEYDVLDALERFSGTIAISMCTVKSLLISSNSNIYVV